MEKFWHSNNPGTRPVKTLTRSLRYPPSVVYITVGLNLQETLKKMAIKYHHIFDTFKHFWVARMRFFSSYYGHSWRCNQFFSKFEFWAENFFWETILWKKLIVRTFGTIVCPKDWSKWPKSEDWDSVEFWSNWQNGEKFLILLYSVI